MLPTVRTLLSIFRPGASSYKTTFEHWEHYWLLSRRLTSNMSNNTSELNGSQSTNSVYVQHSEGKDMMTISFEYTTNGKSKSFNLYRKAEEPLSLSLERIRLNLAKVTKVRKSKKEVASHGDEEEEVDLQVIQNDAPLDPKKFKNVDAWTEGAIMKLNGSPYVIRRNEPQVTMMKLPTIIMKDFTTLPSVDVANCLTKNCEFQWYRQISSQLREKLLSDPSNSHKIETKNNSYWLHLSTGITYSPTIDDVAHYLKVVCYPHSGEKHGPPYSCLSGRPVEVGPTDCPFEKRHALTSKQYGNCETIRLVSYNILADLYADQDYSRKVLFAHCPAHALDIDYRRQLLLKELHGYNADIVCLQEVDRREFLKTYSPYFKLVTKHEGVFNTKAGEVSEGLATFFREDRFELLDTHRTVISRLIDPTEVVDEEHHPILDDLDSMEAKNLLALFDDIGHKIRSNDRLKSRFINRHTVLQTNLLKFKDAPETYLIVANTHLYFHPDADHVRLLQGGICVKYLEFIKSYYTQSIKTSTGTTEPKIKIIFCGDMNSTPDCGLYKLVHEGKVGKDLKDWRSNEEEEVKGLEIETGLRFRTAYKDIQYTNYTPGFNGCLDYIYYEQDGISCESIVPLPDHDDVTITGGIPSDVFPSDHLALIAHLNLKH